MATGPITLQQLTNASLDADDYDVVVNGGSTATTVNRAGNTLPSVAKFYADITQQYGDAAASADRAEAAATAASISAKVYATPAAGVAAGTGVPVGDYFNVRSPDDESYVDEYQNVGGTAVATGKSYPSAGAVQVLAERTYDVEAQVDAVEANGPQQVALVDPSEDLAFAIADIYGTTKFGVGSTRLYGALESPISVPWAGVPPDAAANAYLVVTDGQGYVFKAYDQGGKLVFDASGESANGIQPPDYTPYRAALPGYDSGADLAPYQLATPYTRVVGGVQELFALDYLGVERQLARNRNAYSPNTVLIDGKEYVKFAMSLPGDTTVRPWIASVDGHYGMSTGSNVIYMHRVTGQSNAIGNPAGISMTPVYPNYSLVMDFGTNYAAGVFSEPVLIEDSQMTLFKPAVSEQLDSLGVPRSAETIAHGMMDGANATMLDMLGANVRMLYAGHGRDSTAYAGLKKGTVPYQNGIRMAARAKVLAAQQGYDFIANITHVIHGESDSADNPAVGVYKGYLKEWRQDVEADTQSALGVGYAHDFIICQYSSFTRAITATTSNVPFDQLAAAEEDPHIHLVGPKYMLQYSDGVHPTAIEMHHLGEYHHKAALAVMATGRWDPVRPKSLVRTGRFIDIEFFVPVEPLVIDTSYVTDPGNYGFRYADDGSTATLQSVAVTGPRTVRLTLSATPTGANKIVGYADRGTAGNFAGPTTGARGCLRDSDPYVSIRDGKALPNYCVHFLKSVA